MMIVAFELVKVIDEYSIVLPNLHRESEERYGAPKIFEILKREGYTGSIDRIQRIMKRAGIRSNITKKYKPTSSKTSVEARENVLEQDFTTETIR